MAISIGEDSNQILTDLGQYRSATINYLLGFAPLSPKLGEFPFGQSFIGC